jgi:hypothetical protein
MRFLKFEVVSGKSGSKLVDIDCESLDNCKPLTEMDIGQEVKEGLLEIGKWPTEVCTNENEKILPESELALKQETANTGTSG